MARNTIPRKYAKLIVLAQRAADGAGTVGVEIGLKLNTQEALAGDRGALLAAETTYRQADAAITGLSRTVFHAHQDALTFATRAKDVLRAFCGNRHGQAWVATGFVKSLEVPRREEELLALTEALHGYFNSNLAHEVASLFVTAARASSLYDALRESRAQLLQGLSTRQQARIMRDTGAHQLRRRLRGLINELQQFIGGDDPRWREFGLNIPAAPTAPAVPTEIEVINEIPGKLLVRCPAVPRATHYRFYYQRDNLDATPVFAGSSHEPQLLLETLEPGVRLDIYVAACNAGGESELSKSVRGHARALAA